MIPFVLPETQQNFKTLSQLPAADQRDSIIIPKNAIVFILSFQKKERENIFCIPFSEKHFSSKFQ